jgi:P27 family predicted phage terminase small subunit
VRGRKPKPTTLKELAGNPGRRPLNTAEPKPVGLLAEPPGWFNEAQRAGWAYAIEHAPSGLLRKIDRSVLAVWVVAEHLHREATEQVLKDGLLIKAPQTGQPMQSPYLAIVNRQAQIMLKAAEQLGFSPAARPRLQVPPPSPNERRDTGALSGIAESFEAFLAEDPEAPTTH